MYPNDSITKIKGIGEKKAQLFNKLGVFTVRDLLYYYPRGYDIYKAPVFIKDLKEGYISAVEGTVTAPVRPVKAGKYVLVNLYLSDGTGRVKLIWFNQPYISKQLRAGSHYIFRGRITRKKNELIMAAPKIYTKESYVRKMRSMQPIYPLTSGITNNAITSAVKASSECFDLLEDYLTVKERQRYGLLSTKNALSTIHFPVSEEGVREARTRLVFDEFTSFLYSVRRIREHNRLFPNPHRISDFSACDRLVRSLGYELTDAQKRCFDDIRSDMSSDHIASRMIQGDVGCGKTIIAMLALLACASNGHQGCIMAPTDVLARQHYEEFNKLLTPLGIRVLLLTGTQTAAEKRKAHETIKAHQTDIVIGTHALIQSSVEFDDLAAVVIDEQHRFGVKQRDAFRQKGNEPYIIVMSATPIPRSLAIILYGEMNLSVIDEMPKNRKPIKNCVIPSSDRQTAFNFIRSRVSEGRQAYVICPMIEESEELDAENVIDYTETLKAGLITDTISVEYLHGKMKKDEKEEVLSRFYSGETQVLVSTTVVEVGVNVQNATVMMVENSERFGLAQLHQLRGRVGRGSEQSYCIFVKGIDSKEIDERLNILTKYNDGMKVAEEDLRLRGPGDMAGLRQSGDPTFILADVIGDAQILKNATEFIDSLEKNELDALTQKAPNLFNSVNSYFDVI